MTNSLRNEPTFDEFLAGRPKGIIAKWLYDRGFSTSEAELVSSAIICVAGYLVSQLLLQASVVIG